MLQHSRQAGATGGGRRAVVDLAPLARRLLPQPLRPLQLGLGQLLHLGVE